MEISDEDLAALMKKYRQKTLNSFYEAVGDGRIDTLDIKKFCEFRNEAHRVDIQAKEIYEPKEDNANGKKSDVLILDAKGIKGLDYKLAACCKPVYGDDIFGFVTRFGCITIHKISCPNAARLLDQYPYRILKVKWSE